MAVWEEFFGIPNSPDILRLKSEALSHLVSTSSNKIEELASSIQDRCQDELCFVLARTRTAALLLRMIRDIAITELPIPESDYFMGLLFQQTADSLVGFANNEDPTSTLLRCFESYEPYTQWFPNNDESSRNTLLWEAGEGVAKVLGMSEHAAFIVLYGNLMIRAIDRWQLRTLLTGIDQEEN